MTPQVAAHARRVWSREAILCLSANLRYADWRRDLFLRGVQAKALGETPWNGAQVGECV